MNTDHSKECLCEAFGLTCERLNEIREECKEIVDRADTRSESLELAYEAGKTPEEKIVFVHIVTMRYVELQATNGRGVENMPGIRTIDLRGSKGLKDLPDILNQIMGGNFPGDDEDDED